MHIPYYPGRLPLNSPRSGSSCRLEVGSGDLFWDDNVADSSDGSVAFILPPKFYISTGCRRLRCLEDPSFSILWLYMGFFLFHCEDSETTRLITRRQEAHKAQERFPTAELVFLRDF